MNYIDIFFRWIISIQNCWGKAEKVYKDKQKYFELCYRVLIVLAVILIFLNASFAAMIIGVFGVIIQGFESVIGWNHSVKKWLKNCVLCNFAFSLVISEQVQKVFGYSLMLPLFITIYLFVWVFLSLISFSEIAMLVNEVISGLFATIFTIGTYVTDILLKKTSFVGNITYYYRNEEEFLMALEEGNSVAWMVLGTKLLENASDFFVVCLPVIGVTALSIIMIKIKIYWMKKNNIVEPEF